MADVVAEPGTPESFGFGTGRGGTSRPPRKKVIRQAFYNVGPGDWRQVIYSLSGKAHHSLLKHQDFGFLRREVVGHREHDSKGD